MTSGGRGGLRPDRVHLDALGLGLLGLATERSVTALDQVGCSSAESGAKSPLALDGEQAVLVGDLQVVELHSGELDRDDVGIPALTIRALAARLGAVPGTLYRHVPGKERLQDLVLDRVLAEVDCDVDRDLPWAEQITVLAWRLRAVLADHPTTHVGMRATSPTVASGRVGGVGDRHVPVHRPAPAEPHPACARGRKEQHYEPERGAPPPR